MSMSASSSSDDSMSTINVTSLIDVMFCLLIAFMVSIPAASQEMVTVDLPHAPGQEISEEEFEYSVISIDANGRVYVGALPLDANKERWTEQLSANQKVIDDGIAFIQGDRTVPFDTIIDVMLALKAAGVSQVGFVTDPKPD